MPGTWQILGVLDAQPDLGGQADMLKNNDIDFSDPMRMFFDSLTGQLADILSPLIRIMLSRPASHYGVTPLVIFREVGREGI